MLLRYSFQLDAVAALIEAAAEAVLDAGTRTPDIAKPGVPPVSTSAMGDAILAELDARAA